MSVLLASFLLIFLAEMGDKTQLVAMAFTARFKVSQVLLAVSAATIVNNFIAVAAGSFISGLFNVDIIKTVSYALFIIFGLWTLFGKEGEEEASAKVFINPFFTVVIFFFISEFGDKTQLATMSLAMKYNAPVYVFIGASLGMIAANAVGVAAGVLLGKKVPAHIVKRIAGVVFITIGIIGLIEIIRGMV
ncbi:MAG: TMEM165/GDT1 family protein [Endomicrobia bacterium]|nr:TMEM165/GDT1 family protein [Endomicrobiia bacterium]MCL2506116.1 TMEM165/GDT1 family protein [Endomicrobiia bacterium]